MICNHQWSKIGIYNKDGSMSVPCDFCDDEITIKQVINIIRDGFKDHLGLDLVEDNDPIVKIIKREIEQDYELDDLDLKPGDVVLDVGAHKGIVSSYLISKYPAISLYAFEPVRDNYELACHNIKMNHKDVFTDCHVMNKAVTSDGRMVNIYANPENSGSGEIG